MNKVPGSKSCVTEMRMQSTSTTVQFYHNRIRSKIPVAFITRRDVKWLAEWMQFRLQIFLMGPVYIKFGFFLVLFAGLVGIGTIVHSRITGNSWKESAFKSYSWLQNSPGADAMNEPTPLATFCANTLYVIGLTCFSFYLGVLNTAIAQWTHDIKAGNLKVVASHHTLLLNWSDQTIPVLRQITVAGQNYRAFGARTVVILAPQAKEDMDAAIRSALSPTELRKIRVITRTGDPSCIQDLRMVGAHRARRTVLLPASEPNAERDMMVQSIALQGAQLEREQQRSQPINSVVYTPPSVEVCSQAMFPKTDWPIIKIPPSTPTAEKLRGKWALVTPSTKALTKNNNFLVMQESSFVGRLIAQSIDHPGLTRLYSELMMETPGSCEFYLQNAKQWPWLCGVTFGEAWKHFPEAVLCGVIRDNRALMCPSNELKIEKTDTLILVARSQDEVTCRKRPMFLEVVDDANHKHYPKSTMTADDLRPNVDSKERSILINHGTNDKKKHLPLVGGGKRKATSKLSIINYKPGNCDILVDLDRACSPGTQIQILCDQESREMAMMQNRHLRYQNIQPIFSVGDPLLLSDLKAIKIEDSDCIILLQNTDSIPLSPRGKLNERSSVSDTQSITTIAHIQHILKGQAQQARRTADRLKLQKKPRLIAECADPSTLALLTDMTTGPLWGKSDIFLPKHIESGVVVQVVLDMRLTAVFEGLLQPNGVELGFRSPSEYGYGTPAAAAAAAAGGEEEGRPAEEARLLLPGLAGRLPRGALVFPGSYNPLHEGHMKLLLAAQNTVASHNNGIKPTVLYEIAVFNADKPPIPRAEVESRLVQFIQAGAPVAISKEPLFLGKAKLFPGAYFVVGSDTAERLIDPKYYNNDALEMVCALSELKHQGCHFVVGGRKKGETFVPLSTVLAESPVQLPQSILELFIGIDEEIFRVDLSSTELREKRKRVEEEIKL
eukprot:CAMPEP_0194664452 /NCGR_PEP_ID=MMETSP0295-20121207/1473_1 /TAXON_ID=39354 /ORGANISM="Heterosigma akashiwo, Strain CCMP2393" /LENGTH=950 /DNA_ID=CAMNT_0039546203 /DNA_START=303 /DNA_END=3155 /DNA_ORIENTATION=-